MVVRNVVRNQARRGIDPATLPKTHDAFAKVMFSQPDLCADMLRWRLPPRLWAEFAGGPLLQEDKEFHDEHLRETRADVLFKVCWESSQPEDYVHLLVEHQSKPDWAINARLAGYCAAVMQRQITQNDGAGPNFKFRPILTWVLYNGSEAWQVPLGSSQQSVDYGELSEVTAARFRCGYELIDLRRIPVDDISPASPRLAACLIVLRGNWSRAALARLRQQQRAQGLQPEPSTAELLAQIVAGLRGEPWLAIRAVSYILANWKRESDEEKAAVKDAVAELIGNRERGDRAMGTFLEDAVQEATPGIMAGILLRLMERRFGTLADEVEGRVSRGSIDELNTWTDRVVDAPSVEAVFNGEAIPPRSRGNGNP